MNHKKVKFLLRYLDSLTNSFLYNTDEGDDEYYNLQDAIWETRKDLEELGYGTYDYDKEEWVGVKMRNLTVESKQRGELLVRKFNEKAQKIYSETDPLTVAYFEEEDSVSIRGALGDKDYMSVQELEDMLSEYYTEIYEEEEL